VFRPGKGLSVVIVNLGSLQIPVKVVLTGVSASQWWSVYIQYTKMEAFGQDLIFLQIGGFMDTIHSGVLSPELIVFASVVVLAIFVVLSRSLL
jgi:hypothetical protein